VAVEKDARGQATMLGARSIRPQSGGTARRSLRSRLSQICAVLDSGEDQGFGPERRPSGCGKAEAGESPSSEAPPVVANRRGPSSKASKGVEDCGAGRERDRESGSVQGARVVSRLQKSERRIFLASMVRHGVACEDPRGA